MVERPSGKLTPREGRRSSSEQLTTGGWDQLLELRRLDAGCGLQGRLASRPQAAGASTAGATLQVGATAPVLR